MPSAQVLNFGEDPYANAMGGFAKSFLNTLSEKQATRRNDELFKRIVDKYGPDAKPEDLLTDLVKGEGYSTEYKRDKAKEIIDLANLKSKNTLTPYQQAQLEFKEQELKIKNKKIENDSKPKAITPYQQRIIDLRENANNNKNNPKPLTDYQKTALKNAEIRLSQEETKLEQAATREDSKFPQLVANYVNAQLKAGEEKMDVGDISDVNALMSTLIKNKENPLPVAEAFNEAYQFVKDRREQINDLQIIKPPYWSKDIPQTEEQAYNQLLQLYSSTKLSQKDLKKIATNSGWTKEQAGKLAQRVLQANGKQPLGPKPKENNDEAAKNAALMGL